MYLKHFVITEVGVKSVNALMHGLTTTTATFPKNITTVYYILYRNSIQNSCIHASEYTAATATAYIYISATHSSYALFSKKICSNILRSDRRNGPGTHKSHINSNKIYGTDSFERFLGLGLYFSVYF